MNEDRYVELMERVTRLEEKVEVLDRAGICYVQDLKDEVTDLKTLIQNEAADAQEKLNYLSRESISRTTFGVVVGIIVSFVIAMITMGV